jgi:IstB-like ATP binding protein
MERSEILDMLATLQLAGMRAAYDEIMSVGIKRQHSVERMIGALLQAEIAAKNARSINYQMGSAKLPLAKELVDLSFDGTPINGALIEQLSTGAFLSDQRNVLLFGPPEPASYYSPRYVVINPAVFVPDWRAADVGDDAPMRHA